MKEAIKAAFIFVTGAAIGAAVTWKVLDVKFEKRFQEELASVKEAFSRSKSQPQEEVEPTMEDSNESDEVEDTDEAEETSDYEEVVTKTGYFDYTGISNISNKTEEGGDDVADRPYVITPDEFGEDPNYATTTLFYYYDKVVSNEYDEALDDDEIEELVGKDALSHFGEYEDDSVFVRNDRLETDYEILLTPRKYSDLDKDSKVGVL